VKEGRKVDWWKDGRTEGRKGEGRKEEQLGRKDENNVNNDGRKLWKEVVEGRKEGRVKEDRKGGRRGNLKTTFDFPVGKRPRTNARNQFS
jgi:hypothetical protein